MKSFVIKREITRKSGKTYTKAPKIQRSVKSYPVRDVLILYTASSLLCVCRGNVISGA